MSFPGSSLPAHHASSNLNSQPSHWQVRSQQVKRNEPGRGGNHETCRHTTAEKDCANRVSNLRLVARCDQVGNEGAGESTNCVRQERHYEMTRLKKVHSLAQTFDAIYIHTRGGRNERRADGDERHVDASAYGDSRDDGKRISK